MAKLTVTNEGGKKLRARIRQHAIVTDQVEKAGGTDSAPNPLEAFVASLGMCMTYFATVYLESNGFEGEGTEFDIEWEAGGKPKRLVKFATKVRLPGGVDLGPKSRALLAAAKCCPVHNSLREDIEVSLELAR